MSAFNQERELLRAANESRYNTWFHVGAFIAVVLVGLFVAGSSYYTTYVARNIAEQKMELYRLCLENQKLAMTAAVDRRGYLSIPDCRI